MGGEGKLKDNSLNIAAAALGNSPAPFITFPHSSTVYRLHTHIPSALRKIYTHGDQISSV